SNRPARHLRTRLLLNRLAVGEKCKVVSGRREMESPGDLVPAEGPGRHVAAAAPVMDALDVHTTEVLDLDLVAGQRQRHLASGDEHPERREVGLAALIDLDPEPLLIVHGDDRPDPVDAGFFLSPVGVPDVVAPASDDPLADEPGVV